MAEIRPDALVDAVGALGLLVARGGAMLDDADRRLLGRNLPRGAVGWRGGIRQDPQGNLNFLDGAVSAELTPEECTRVGDLLGAAYVGFYDAAADGLAVTDARLVDEWYGASVRENYPEAGAAFLRFATTYWTFKVAIRQLELVGLTPLVLPILTRLDGLLADLFFPFEGPAKIDPDRREADQRRFLAAFGPRVDAVDFLARNPILLRDRRDLRKRWWNR